MDGIVSPASTSPWTQKNALTQKSTLDRRSWFTGSPHELAVLEEDQPMLRLTHFTKKVMVCFDKVRLGTSKTCQLYIENPFDFPQELIAEKFPYKKGFSIPEDRWVYEKMEMRVLPITWTPSEAGNVREMVTFKCDGTFRLQVILLGTAEEKLKGKPRRGTFLLKRSNRNICKVPGKIRHQRLQQNGSTTNVSQIYQQPRPSVSHGTTTKQTKPVVHKRRSNNVGKENVPRHKDTMLKEFLNPAKRQLNKSLVIASPTSKRSPLQERTSVSPFLSVDTSLVEITNGTSPGTSNHKKRDTLSLCDGMSPLLQTSFVYCGDLENSHSPDISQEVFDDSIEVFSESIEIATSTQPLTVSKHCSTMEKPTVEGTKRLSKEAQVTVTKRKVTAPTLTPPTRRQSRRTLFANPAQVSLRQDEDLRRDQNSPKEESKATKLVSTTVTKSQEHSVEFVDPRAAQRALFDKSLTHLHECENMPNSKHNELDSQPNSTVKEEDLFPVHKSIVTKKLTSKHKSDPPKSDTCNMHKKRKTPTGAVRKPLTKKPCLSSTKGTQQDNNKIKKSKGPVEPNRGMTRTMMLRRAAAGLTTSVSKPKPVRGKRPIKGVPMAKLNLVKQNKTALPRHPMPFAAKNMFYDERWMEKQEQGFTRWLNYVLTPDDCPNDPSCKATKIDAGALFVEANQQVTVALAPSNEDLSLRAYTARRKLNKLRRAACLLFQSEPVVRVIQKVEFEVERGGLKIRTDRKIHADYGIKQRVLNMFLSYNPLWLRIGLETVFGEILPIQSNTDILGLSRFVVQRLLWNPDIAQKYVHSTVPGLYAPGFEAALCQFTLKKFLLLVFFLDRAKLTRLIDHNPCLFCKDAEYKSSRELLLEFSRQYLQGEGDVTKHLSYYGYCVNHTQTALDEFDFAVSKLATDLRCGVRLARIVELLTKKWALSRELRVPAISRLQKIHNTEAAFKALVEYGIDVEGGGVNTRAIVDGHREKTLELLWRIIFYFQVEVMLNQNQIKEEISYLKRNLQLRHDLTTLETSLGMLGLKRDRRQSLEPNVYFKSERLSLLLQWCQAVCHFYGLKVENFTVSFSDGRALCYLVHHYHPSLLPLNTIQQDTTQTQYQRTESPSKSDADDSFDGTWANAYSPSTGKPGEYERLLANERHNYKTLYEKVRELGGIPMMIKSAEMSNTIPDEKVVIVYVSYLCTRLLDLHAETRAARLIQMKWRAYQLRRKQKQRQMQIKAATKIQGVVRVFLTRRRHARILATVIKMQTLLRCKLAKKRVQRLRQERLEKRQHTAAVIIQSQVKSYLEQKRFHRLKASTIILQSALRGYLIRHHIHKQHLAAFTIQSRYQAWKLMQLARSQFLGLRSAAVTLQSIFRGHAARKEACRMRAARTIQAYWRGYCTHRAYTVKRYSAVIIQGWFRMCLVRQEYHQIKNSTLILQRHVRAYLKGKQERRGATMIQALVRGYLVRQQVKLMNCSAVCIQSNFRAYIRQKHYQEKKQAIQTIQMYWRATLVARQQTRHYQIYRGACITMQASVRGFLVRQHIRKMHHAAICIQINYKAHRDYIYYQKVKTSTTVLQTYWRCTLKTKQQSKQYQVMRGATITIQSLVRGFIIRQHLNRQKAAAVCIQTNYRAHLALKSYQQTRQAAQILQKHWKATILAKKQTKEYELTRRSCITIQAYVRGFLCRHQVQKMDTAATCIQTNYRAHLACKKYQTIKQSANVLQTYWRATLIAKQQRRAYQVTRGAIITIQMWVRRYLVHRQIKKMNAAATCIQSNFRANRDLTAYQNMRENAKTIQRYWRATLVARKQYVSYQITRGACITIQALVRGYLTRRNVQNMHLAATLVQSGFRGYQARTHYQNLKKATITLQIYWRAILLGRERHRNYTEIKRAAIVMQAMFRGRQARDCAHKERAARTIQAAYRMSVTRQAYVQQKQATILIQARYRALKAQQLYQRIRLSAIVIQQYYRGWLQTRELQSHFTHTRLCIIKIQSTFRMFVTRKMYIETKRAAVIIQARYRGFKACTEYKRQKKATIAIQRYYRSVLTTRQTKANFTSTRASIVKIQSYFRMYVQRKQYTLLKQVATVLQAYTRGKAAYLEYNRLKQAAVVIQTRYRATLVAQKQQLSYQFTRGAIITIQAVFRGYQTRKRLHQIEEAVKILQIHWRATLQSKKAKQEYQTTIKACVTLQATVRGFLLRRHVQKMHMAATCIQAHYRCNRDRSHYQKLKQAAVCLQSFWRATLLMKQQLKNYSILREACLTIQSCARGFLVRQHVKKMDSAAICIQNSYRRHCDYKRYHTMRQSAKVLQCYWRSTLVARQQTRDYQITRSAIITIQAWVRGYMIRQQLKTMNSAALCIQTNYRAYFALKSYQRVKQAILILQKYWKASLLAKQQTREYQIKRRSCITIQAYVHGFLLRRQVQKMNSAATCIQTNFRSHIACKKYQTSKQSANVLQTYWRATLIAKKQRRAYQVTRGAVITIQAWVRGYLVRQQIKGMTRAAICIQSNFRAHRDLTAYQKMRRSVKTLQSYWRSVLITRQQTMDYQITRGALITIQAWVRGYLIRQQRKKIDCAAICIQSNFRAYIGQKHYQQKKQAAQAIQMYWRAKLVAKKLARSYQINRSACIIMQSGVRGFLVRQHIRKIHHAAACIQSNYKAHRDYTYYQKLKSATVLLQTYWRSAKKTKQQAKQYQVTRGAVITIQAWVRGFVVRQLLKKQIAAATCIQTKYRTHLAVKSYQQTRQAILILQKYWKTSLLAKKLTREYQVIRSSCITIQAYVRGFLLRRQVQKMNSAATCIQANFRSHIACKKYQTLKQSANVLLTYWRATLIAKQQRKAYQVTRGAAITIQAWVRGYLVRQQIKRMNKAATCIQSNFRAHRDLTAYQKMRRSAKTLQSYWRSVLITRQQTMHYQITRGALITIQAWVRGYLIRQQRKKMDCAAICIQSNFRAYIGQKHYQQKKQAAQAIQMYWRAKLVAKKLARSYQITRSACITMQSGVRGFLVRQRIRKMHHAAACIQSNYKAHRDYTYYQKLKSATVLLQTYWRSAKKTKQQAKQYQVTRGAVITIQAWVRGFVVRQHLKKQIAAATCIQTNYRSHLAVKSYQQTRLAILLLQKYWKTSLLAKKLTRKYQVTRKSCITIQAYVRGFLLRRQVQKMNFAATCIQANFRSHIACKKYQTLKQYANVLQTYWRATLIAKKQRKAYQVTRGAAITIQAWVRGYLVRKQIKRMNRAATCIQSNFRAYIDLTAYQMMTQSAKTIQSYWRCTLVCRKQYIEYQITRGACITIQSWVRGFLSRCHVQNMHLAATRIQSSFRRYQTCTKYQKLRYACSVLQIHWKAVLLGRQHQKHYTDMRKAAIVIQATFRGQQARCCANRERCARTIQAAFRMYVARQVYLEQKQAAIMIQTRYRACTARKVYHTMRSSAIVIQQHYKSLLNMRQVQTQFMNTRIATIKMQSTFRMLVQRKAFLQKKTAAIKIQTKYRAYKIQTQYRRQRESATIIQRYYRNVLITRQIRTKYVSTRESIVKIQSYLRMHRQRQQYASLKRAATVLQAYARGKAACVEYNRLKQATVVIQTRYRATLEAHKQQLTYKFTRGAIITIQAFFRGLRARKLASQIRAAILIQAVCRGFVQRQRYQSLRKNTVLIQSVVRGIQARRMFAAMQCRWSAAVCIQKIYRGYTARKEVMVLRKARLAQVHRFTAAVFHHLCAIRVQRTYRNYCIMKLAKQRLGSIICIQQWMRAKLERVRYIKLQRGTILLQKAVRRHQKVRNAAAVKVQSYARMWLTRQYVYKMKESAVKIQCMWRGYRVRAANKSKKVAAARARCLAANAAATEEKKLCNRTTSALDYLLQYKNLSYILEALMNLDVVTRLSPICCERLVEVEAVPVLYTLIRSCNRSQPCKEVIKYSVSILLNLVKYPKTAQAVFDVPDSISTIVDLMQMYREKGTLIFCETCLLLGTLSQDPERAEAIHAMPNITEKVKSIHRLAERKHKMDSKRMDARKRSLSSSSYLNSSQLSNGVTPRKKPKHKRVQPDWVLGRGRMRAIQDPMHAITFLRDALRK